MNVNRLPFGAFCAMLRKIFTPYASIGEKIFLA